jgi:hypothetical protein
MSYLNQQKAFQKEIDRMQYEIDNYYQTGIERFNEVYKPRIDLYSGALENAKKSGDEGRISTAERRLQSVMEQRDRAIQGLEAKEQDFVSRRTKSIESFQARMEAPAFQQGLEYEKQQIRTKQAEAEVARVAEQRKAEAEKFRMQQEGFQREEAERQASRFRARGSRGASRPMLSAARMAPEQTMAPAQTLGAFMSK